MMTVMSTGGEGGRAATSMAQTQSCIQNLESYSFMHLRQGLHYVSNSYYTNRGQRNINQAYLPFWLHLQVNTKKCTHWSHAVPDVVVCKVFKDHSPQLNEAHLLGAGQWVCLATAIQQPWLMVVVCCCVQQCWTVNTFNAALTQASFQFTADGNRQNSLQRLRSWTQLQLPTL